MPDPIQLSVVTISDGTTSETYEVVDETARNNIGDLDDLQTTAKTNIVAAVNELAQATDVFWATYGSTTNADIETALTAGKTVLVKVSNSGTDYIIPLTRRASATDHRFGAAYAAGSVYVVGASCISGTWNSWNRAVEPAVTEVTVTTAGAVSQALDAGKIYHFTGALTSLTITLNAPGTGIVAQYHFDFNSGSTAPTVTLPNSVTMQGGTFAPEASKRYEVDILNGYGVAIAW